jgi:hypothetical protein
MDGHGCFLYQLYKIYKMADCHENTSMIIVYGINFLCRKINILETFLPSYKYCMVTMVMNYKL